MKQKIAKNQIDKAKIGIESDTVHYLSNLCCHIRRRLIMAGSNKMNTLAADKPVEHTARATTKWLPVACRNPISKYQITNSSFSGLIFSLRGNISCLLSTERAFLGGSL